LVEPVLGTGSAIEAEAVLVRRGRLLESGLRHQPGETEAVVAVVIPIGGLARGRPHRRVADAGRVPLVVALVRAGRRRVPALAVGPRLLVLTDLGGMPFELLFVESGPLLLLRRAGVRREGLQQVEGAVAVVGQPVPERLVAAAPGHPGVAPQDLLLAVL